MALALPVTLQALEHEYRKLAYLVAVINIHGLDECISMRCLKLAYVVSNKASQTLFAADR